MKLTRIIKFIIYFFSIWFVGHTTFILIDGFSDDRKAADVCVILGTKVNNDGTLSERLIKRLGCGLNLYRKGRVKKLIVSGGLGHEGYYEGNKMRDYLLKNGVPDSAIIVDNMGNNSRATVKNTLSLKDSLNFHSVIVVSQYFHLTRCKMLFRKHGFNEVSSVCPNYFEIRDFRSVPREFFAFYSQLLFG